MSDISFVYVSGTLDRAMGQTKKKVVARRHLVCGNCASWVHLETSGCEKKWADTRAEGFVFTCKGCTEVAVLVKEVSGLKQMMEDMKETVAGLHLEDKGAETGSRVTTTGVSQDREETAGNSRTEDTDTGIEDKGEGRTEDRTEICAGMMTGVSQDREETAGNSISEDTDIEDEGEGRTEERTEICAGTRLMATHAYTKNQENPIGKEIDLQQWDTLIFKGEHAERKLEPSTRQNRTSGIRTSRVPGGHPRHDNRGTGKRHYQEGTREQYRGKPDWTGGRTKEELFSGSDRWHQEKHYDLRWRLYHPENRYKTEQGGGRSRVFTGSKNRACDRESRGDRGKRKWRDHTSTRRDEQHGQGRNNGDS